MENLSTERNAELLRTVAEKNQELELLESQYKESELNREKLRRTVDDKSNQIRLLQEEVDSLRVSGLCFHHLRINNLNSIALGENSFKSSRAE